MSYKNKYLKYKNKYLALKNQLGGTTNAAETVPIKCEKGEYDEEKKDCNEPFPCLDSESRCLNKNGDTLPIGSYYYVISIGDESLKGNVTLIR